MCTDFTTDTIWINTMCAVSLVNHLRAAVDTFCDSLALPTMWQVNFTRKSKVLRIANTLLVEKTKNMYLFENNICLLLLLWDVPLVFFKDFTFGKFTSQMFSSADKSLKNENCQLLLRDGFLVKLHTLCLYEVLLHRGIKIWITNHILAVTKLH